MLAAVAAQLRRQPARALTMLLGVLVATSGFTLLTGAVQTSRLQVTGTVDEHFRAAYDILVRPAGSRGVLEQDEGLVRPNFLSGRFGGVTFQEYERVAAMPGVEVAAPVAMVGYTQIQGSVELDITEHVDRSANRQLLRLRHTWSSDRGLSRIDDPGFHYVYLTRNEVLWPAYERTDEGTFRFAGYRRGDEPVEVDTAPCEGQRPPVEVWPDGRVEAICNVPAERFGQVELTAGERTRLEVWHVRQDGSVEGFEDHLSRLPSEDPVVRERLRASVRWPIMLLVAAIDPAQEAELVGLDQAMVWGRHLRADDEPVPRGSQDVQDPDGDFDPRADVPMLVSDTVQVDEQLTSIVEQMYAPQALTQQPFGALVDELAELPGTRVASHGHDAEEAYRPVAADARDGSVGLNFNRVLRSGQPTYRDRGDAVLQPAPLQVDPERAWSQEQLGAGSGAPIFATDTAFRPLERMPEIGLSPVPDIVGVFDPAALVEFSPLSQVPLETYQPAQAQGADDATIALLGGEPLAPNSNPGGYLATPPQLLTTFASLDEILGPGAPNRQAPISAIRIRVADQMAGVDPQSQDQLHQVATRIAEDTGLEVDVTIGSSPGPQTVRLPAGSHGRPALQLHEDWSNKGLAVRLVQEVDRKSLLLFGLILLACALFLGNAVSASVRLRRRELAVLSCLGWPRHRVTALVLAEVATVGLGAGTIAVGLAWPLAAISGITLTPLHALAALPVAVGLALTAGLLPAVRATLGYPAAALHLPVLGRGGARRLRGMPGLAWANVARVPARSLVGVAALTVGTAAVTALTLITWHFHDDAQGTLLGDAITLQVRAVDLAAAATTVALGVLAITDALYLNVRERSSELAALRACGWSDGELGRMVVYEGAFLGALGATLGAGLGLAAMTWFIGPPGVTALATAAGVAVAGMLVTILAAAAPAQLLRGLPLAAVLAED